MSSISDKDIDRIFQEAAEKYSTTFDEEAWKDIDRRLDGNEPDGGMGYFRILGVVIGLFIISSMIVGWYALRNVEVDNVAATSINDGNTAQSSDASKGTADPGVPEQTSDSVGNNNGIGESPNSPLYGEQDQSGVGKNDIKSRTSDRDSRIEARTGSQEKDQMALNDAVSETGEAASERKKEEQTPSSFDRDEEVVLERPLENEATADQDKADEQVVISLADKDAGLLEAKSSKPIFSGKEGEDIMLKKDLLEKAVSDNDKAVFDENKAASDEGDRDVIQGVGDEKSVVMVEQKRSVSEEGVEHVLTESGRESKSKGFYLQQGTLNEPDSVLRMGYLPWYYPLGDGELLPVPVKEGEKEEKAKRGFALKLTYSPDFSSIGYFKPDKPGSNFGLLGEYFIGKRWSISTGAIYSKKIYFNEEGGGGYSAGPTDRLDADCRVIDIPLNIHYYAQQADNHSLYLTAGASSYVMLRENYNYTKTGVSGPWSWSEEIKNENSHWFSILNLSVGYERRIGRHLFLQLEPFLKAPMSGVGEGKVDLVSTGAFLNLKYQFIPE